MANGGAAPAASLSLAGRILGLATSLVLHPLLRRGNAAPSTRRVLEVLGAMIGGCAGGTDLRHCQLGGVPVDIVSPGRAGQGSIMYLHGGAYVSGSLRSYRRLVTHLAAATGCRVIAVDYRLAPAHPYPAAYADSLAHGRSLRMALNQVMSPESAQLSEGAEVAFFPPVTGG